jgi:hypothetical protein
MNPKTKTTLILFIIGLVSCSLMSKQNDHVIDVHRMGDIRLCDNISDVAKQFKSIENLSFEGDEGVTWTGKKVKLSDKEWILLESSWIDSSKIWRISTNSTKYTTENGYRIGDNVAKIKQNHDEILYNESEQGFELKSHSIRFGFSIEEKYTDDFYKKISDCNNCLDFQKFINDNATITEIIISGDCKK